MKDKTRPIQLQFGKINPVSYSVYVKKEADPKVYTVGEYIFTSLNLTVNDFREHTLLPKRSNELQKITLKQGSNILELERADSDWMLKKPYAYRASSADIMSLLNKMKELRIEEFLDNQDILPPSLLSHPVIEAFFTWQKLEKPDRIMIGDVTTDKKFRYARLASDPSPVQVNAESPATFVVDPLVLIDKRILTKYSFDYNKITIDQSNKSYTFSQDQDDTWHFTESENNTDQAAVHKNVKEIIDVLAQLRAQKFYIERDNSAPDMTDQRFSVSVASGEKSENSEKVTFLSQHPQDEFFLVWAGSNMPVVGIATADSDQIIEKVQHLIEIVSLSSESDPAAD